MNITRTFLVIGENALTIACMNYLLTVRGAKVVGVVSTATEVEHWARRHNIPVYLLNQLLENFHQGAFDYLFSVANSKILLEPVLRLPKKFAINCHYSLLPKYAGCFPTAWSILNGEKKTGVTWHLMSKQVDAGDIVKQVPVALDKDETVRSLHIKCFDVALNSFVELVEDITSGNLKQTPQHVIQDFYHSLHEKPPYGGVVNFQQTAKDIYAMCRGLSLVERENKLGTLKVILNNRAFVINNMSVAKVQTKLPPGTLVRVSQQDFSVTTATEDVIIKKLSTLEGKPCAIGAIFKTLQLKEKDNIAIAEKELADLKPYYERMARRELYWLNTLRTKEPALDEKLSSFEWSSLKDRRFLSVLDLSAFRQETTFETQSVLLSLLLIYFYRLNNFENFTVPLNLGVKESTSCLQILFEDNLPFITDFVRVDSFELLVEKVKKKLAAFKENLTFSRDLYQRFPNLTIGDSNYFVRIQFANESEIAFKDDRVGLLLIIDSNRCSIQLQYNADELPVALEQADAHIKNLASAIIKAPTKRINQFNFLSIAEHEKVTSLFVRPGLPTVESANTAVELFALQKNASPKSVAVSCGGETLTYEALDLRSNQLARYLMKKNLCQGDLVAIDLRRSVDLIVSILGILKAGAAYVPIDAKAPELIKSHLLENAKPSFLLTSAKEAFDWQAIKQQCTQILFLEDEKANIEQERTDSVASTVTKTDLAYIIYTSGTTGAPKGVCIEHGSLARLAMACKQYFDIQKEMRILQYSSLGFDGAVWDIFSAILNGATLVLAKEEQLLPGDPLLHTLQKNKINMVALPASVLNLFLPSDPLPDLKILLSVGDVCSKHVMSFWTKRLNFYNGYGPTECTVSATLHKFTKGDSPFCIGKSWIPNTCTYVLDEDLNPLPVGVPGVLYVGGNISTGYFKEPQLTEERFIDFSLNQEKTIKLYCTNDVVCWRSDGTLRYIGRTDTQVKIRGFRIHIETIEEQLKSYREVKDCAVLIKEQSEHEKIIVAYVVFSNMKNANILKIKEKLYHALPEYMLPRIFEILPFMPLTLNGKIDKKALPEPNLQLRNVGKLFVAPTTETEKQITEIWTDVLRIDKVSIYDNFFDVGGHSLLVAQLLARIYRELGVHISFQGFIKNPTIRHMAKIILKQEPIEQRDSQTAALEDITDYKAAIKTWAIPKPKPRSRFSCVLITGSTGFLGRQLLYELCKGTESTTEFFCLIRAQSTEHLKAKFKELLNTYPIKNLQPSEQAKIIPLLGDIAEHNLGVEQAEYDLLANKIDVIYHCAADVNHLYGYKQLRRANVQSTFEIIKFAATKTLKKINFISTLSAIGKRNTSGRLVEDFLEVEKRQLMVINGYSETKWASEVLLKIAVDYGVPVDIYRPGWILWDDKTLVDLLKKNTLFTLLQSCLLLNYAPKWKLELNLLSVKTVSQFVVNTGQEQMSRRVFNMINEVNVKWHDVVHLLKKKKYIIDALDPKLWHKKCMLGMQTIFSLMSVERDLTSTKWLQMNNLLQNIEHSAFSEQSKKLGFSFSEKKHLVFLKALAPLASFFESQTGSHNA